MFPKRRTITSTGWDVPLARVKSVMRLRSSRRTSRTICARSRRRSESDCHRSPSPISITTLDPRDDWRFRSVSESRRSAPGNQMNAHGLKRRRIGHPVMEIPALEPEPVARLGGARRTRVDPRGQGGRREEGGEVGRTKTEEYQLLAASGAAISAEHYLETARAFDIAWVTTHQTALGAASCYARSLRAGLLH